MKTTKVDRRKRERKQRSVDEDLQIQRTAGRETVAQEQKKKRGQPAGEDQTFTRSGRRRDW
jgi:hypothetical protein